MTRVAVVLSWIAVACGGGGSGGGGGSRVCFEDADCEEAFSERCLGPGDDATLVCDPNEQCRTDSDCQFGDRCQVFDDPCSDDGFGTLCLPDCTSDLDCGMAGVLECDRGACVPISCTSGRVRCGRLEECEDNTASDLTQRSDGCAARICTFTTDCVEGGLCVSGTCQTGPGRCSGAVVE